MNKLFALTALLLSFSFCAPIHAAEFSYQEYIEKKFEQSEHMLNKMNKKPVYESELREFSESGAHLYWSGVHNALEDVRDSVSSFASTDGEDFSCRDYIKEKLEHIEQILNGMTKRPVFESNLKDYSKEERYLYWSGFHNALENIKHAERHARWVKKNNLGWNGIRWVPRN